MNQPLFIGMTFWPLCCHGGNDGKIFIVGGCNLGFVMNTEYDFDTDSTTEYGQVAEPGSDSVRSPGLGGFEGYYILATGNIDAAGYTKTTKKYTVATDTWLNGTDSPEPSRSSVGSGVVGAYLYVVGGAISAYDRNPLLNWANQTRDLDEYDPVGDSWSSKTNQPEFEWFGHETPGPACLTDDGKLTYTKHWIHGSENRVWMQSTDSWSQETGPTNQFRYCGYSSVSGSGYCYGNNPASRQNIAYSFGGDSWADKTGLPEPDRRNNLAGTKHGTTCISFGGQPSDTYDPLRDVDHYDTETDAWISKTDLGTGRHSSGSVTLQE